MGQWGWTQSRGQDFFVLWPLIACHHLRLLRVLPGFAISTVPHSNYFHYFKNCFYIPSLGTRVWIIIVFLHVVESTPLYTWKGKLSKWKLILGIWQFICNFSIGCSLEGEVQCGQLERRWQTERSKAINVIKKSCATCNDAITVMVWGWSKL
jgi:hypothetical protein